MTKVTNREDLDHKFAVLNYAKEVITSNAVVLLSGGIYREAFFRKYANSYSSLDFADPRDNKLSVEAALSSLTVSELALCIRYGMPSTGSVLSGLACGYSVFHHLSDGYRIVVLSVKIPALTEAVTKRATASRKVKRDWCHEVRGAAAT